MELRIRVGAAVDRSMSEAFRPLLKAAEQARAALERQSKGVGTARAEATRSGLTRETRLYGAAAREIERWEREKVRLAERSAAARAKAADAAARADVRASERAAREKARIEGRERAGAERALRIRSRAQRDDERRYEQLARYGVSRLRAGASTVAQLTGAAARKGFAVAGDIARGAGVDASVGSVVAKNSDLQTVATKVSNSGVMENDPRNVHRVDPGALERQALDVGIKTGTDANTILGGLDKYTAKTGDLQTGRDVLERMAVLSKATGSSLDNMMDAAGDIGNALGDVENKGQLIQQVMKSIAAEGKMGAVEIKDLATQMAKLGAASAQYTGNRADVLVQMGALTQMTRAKGGAASATQAATSLGSFTNVFSKNARLKAFDAAGVQVYGADKKIRSPIEIIKDALAATGGDNAKMGQMFADVGARRVTRGFETVYKDAGGGEAGLIAVQRAFEDLRTATISDEEVAQSFAAAMRTSQSQAEIFNQQLRKSALEVQEQITPAFVALAPAVLEATKAFAGAVTWLTGDKQLDNVTGMVKRDVPSAIASTEKQIAGGKISSAQMESDRIAQNEAREAFSRASAEFEQAKADAEAKKTNLSINDKALRAFDSFAGTDVSGVKATDAKVEEKRGSMEEARQLYQSMMRENAKVAEQLRTGQIRVVIVGDTRAPDVSGQLTAGTRTPAPGTKPR